MHFSKENRPNTVNGIIFVALFSFSSLYLASISVLSSLGISSLMVAIVLGMFYGNTLHHRLPKEWSPGIHFCSKKLLRLAIILYGFRVSFQQIVSVGLEGVLIDLWIVGFTIGLGVWIGMKILKLDWQISLLVSSASAICGAAAVLAIEDVTKSEAYKTAIAIATVVLFGTVSMFLYPALQHADVFGFSDSQYGLFTGASVHEVAQVVVAGSNVSEESAAIAIVVKMTRVLLLIPVLFICSLFVKQNGERKKRFVVPWFALFFMVVIGFNSLNLLPLSVVAMINQFDTLLLTMAMAAIGMETNFNKMKNAGLKPFYLASLLFIWLMGSSYCLVKMF